MSSPRLHISLGAQRLHFFDGDDLKREFPISTALNGAGELYGSGCTPRGLHRIRARVGDGLPEGAVFVGRRFTGEIFTPALAAKYPQRDWILSRILWLCGCEPGRNRGGDRDTQRRFIYLHGTPDSEPMGIPRSHGCIRMRNKAIIWLFERLPAGTPVLIEE